jgi:Fe2+ transport system protein FeoA
MTTSSSLPLSELKKGDRAVIKALVGGMHFQTRLIGMGMNIGSELEVTGSVAKGQVIIKIRETRIALGHGMAEKIIVTQKS